MLNPRINCKEILFYLIGILVFILSGSVMISTKDSGFVFHSFSLILIILVFVCITTKLKFIKIYQIFIPISIFTIWYLTINMLNYPVTIKGLVLRIIWFLLFFWFCIQSKHDVSKFLKVIYNLIFIISVISLIMFIFINILHLRIPFRNIGMGNNPEFYKSYFGIFYTSETYHKNILGISFYRLQSLFWEPGIFAIYLNIAIFYYTFYIKNGKVYQLLIFLTCMALTLSTTGICLVCILTAICFVKNFKICKKGKIILAIPVSISAILIGMFVWIEKMQRTNIVDGSYYLRRNDLMTGLKLMLKKPVLGFGYKNNDVFMLASRAERGNSNGLVTWGYTMGILGLLLVLIPFIYTIIKIDKEKKLEEIVFFVLFIMFNMTEPLLISPLMLFLIAFEYSKCFLISHSKGEK